MFRIATLSLIILLSLQCALSEICPKSVLGEDVAKLLDTCVSRSAASLNCFEDMKQTIPLSQLGKIREMMPSFGRAAWEAVSIAKYRDYLPEKIRSKFTKYTLYVEVYAALKAVTRAYYLTSQIEDKLDQCRTRKALFRNQDDVSMANKQCTTISGLMKSISGCIKEKKYDGQSYTALVKNLTEIVSKSNVELTDITEACAMDSEVVKAAVDPVVSTIIEAHAQLVLLKTTYEQLASFAKEVEQSLKLMRCYPQITGSIPKGTTRMFAGNPPMGKSAVLPSSSGKDCVDKFRLIDVGPNPKDPGHRRVLQAAQQSFSSSGVSFTIPDITSVDDKLARLLTDLRLPQTSAGESIEVKDLKALVYSHWGCGKLAWKHCDAHGVECADSILQSLSLFV